MEKVIYKDETYQIQCAIFEVYIRMGPRFLEAVYQECLAIEFSRRSIPFEKEQDLKLYCDNQVLNQSYRTDFICFGKIIIELKAAKDLNENHYAQIINYLKGTGMRLGLWVNFGSYSQVTMKRFAH